jgi:hypothetical protein
LATRNPSHRGGFAAIAKILRIAVGSFLLVDRSDDGLKMKL